MSSSRIAHVLKRFQANTEGRDFVIGDLHGSYSLFVQLLKHLNFDATVDRMFSVGDLVDRGPENLKCLQLLREPWFHAVLANHEQMMLEAFYDGYMGQFWIQNGGAWGLEALNTWRTRGARAPSDDEHQLFELLEEVKRLPYCITVERQDGTKVHIIHAELPPNQRITDDDLASPERVMELATVQSRDGDFMVWGRYLFYNFYCTDLSNQEKIRRAVAYNFRNTSLFSNALSPIISGHTIVQRPFTLLGQTNIDTGAFGALTEDARSWQALTCIDLNEWKFYQSRPSGVTEVVPFVVTRAEVDALSEAVRPSAVNKASKGDTNDQANPES